MAIIAFVSVKVSSKMIFISSVQIFRNDCTEDGGRIHYTLVTGERKELEEPHPLDVDRGLSAPPLKGWVTAILEEL